MTILYLYKQEDEFYLNEITSMQNGYHFIGREAPVISNDKRMSRKHARLVVHRNGAIIESVHKNPTFFKSAISETIQILREYDALSLNNGDRFALLEDGAWYKVKIIYENTENLCSDSTICNTNNNKRPNEGDSNEINKRIKIEPENSVDQRINTFTGNNVVNPQNITKEPMEFGDVPSFIQPPLEPTEPSPNLNEPLCHLPSTSSGTELGRISKTIKTEPSDLSITESLSNLDTTVSLSDLETTQPLPDLETTLPLSDPERTLPSPVQDTNLPQPNPTLLASQSNGNMQLESYIGGNNETNDPPSSSNNGNNSTSDPTNNQAIKTEPPDNSTSNPTNNQVIKTEPPDNSTSDPTNNKAIKTEPPDNSTSDPNQPSSSTDSPNLRRDRCWYGPECYRKNPVHKQNFSHPLDDDYDSDSNDSTPVCPFGRLCYRRNVMHRRLYKHFGKPAPKPNINVQLHVSNCTCCNRNRHKPGYESDYDHHDSDTEPEA